MKAWLREAYGTPELLQLKEVPRPSPGPGEVLIRVKGSSVAAGDGVLLSGKPYLIRLIFGLWKPSNPVAGTDVAGIVEEVGSGVASLQVGDEVFGEGEKGTLAEFAVVKESLLAKKPKGLGFVESAALPVGGCTALQGLRDAGKIKEGSKVLIVGASGGVGCLAVQIAKALGAGEVTAVCSGSNANWVKELGADRVIDYTKDDFTAGDPHYDLVFDAIGNKALGDCQKVMVPDGIYVSVGGGVDREWVGPFPRIMEALARSAWGPQKFAPLNAFATAKDLDVLRELVEGGKLKPIIDTKFNFESVPDAYRAQLAGHQKGRLVIEV